MYCIQIQHLSEALQYAILHSARYGRRNISMRIVIKIGTSTITHPTGRLNIRQMEALCKVLSDLKNAGN